MPGSPNPVSNGNLTGEHRDSRFAELDTQLKAEKAAQQRSPGMERKPKRRRLGPRLPAEVRKEITYCVQQLRHHRKLFIADPKLKDRASRFLRSMLPPRRKRGRPGIPGVTQAILLLKKLQRESPEQSPRERWQLVYGQVIPNYGNLTREQQRGQEVLLREQVRSRRNQRRRRLHKWSRPH